MKNSSLPTTCGKVYIIMHFFEPFSYWHFISVYYALFCVIKMPAIPLFIGHCGQYKTLWYFIIKCKKFKCLWEGF